MAKSLQTKVKSSFSGQVIEIVLIAILSVLLFNRKASITKDEAEFTRSLRSYAAGRFCFYRNLPLPALMSYGLYKVSAYLNTPLLSLALESPRLTSLFLFIMTMTQIHWLARETYSRVPSWIVATVHVIGLLVNTHIIFLTNEMFSIYFLVSGIVQLKKNRTTTSGFLIGLSIASSWASLSILPPLMIFYGLHLFSFVVNPANRIRKAVLKLAKGIAAFILLPASVYTLSFLIHYSIQQQYTDDAEKFSIEFQATLKGSVQEPADRYLMDRSIVTIFNQKHLTYLNMKGGTPSCSDQRTESSMWMMIKVHPTNSTGNVEEEGRYINHGDLVKLVELGSSMCLRVSNEDTEDKFKKVIGFTQQDNEADEEDIWQIIGDGPVVSRSSLIRFRHYKTAMDLCVRNLRKLEEEAKRNGVEKVVGGSLYSDNKSRLFYISDNRNHDSFKKNFKDGRPKETILSFPQKSFIQKMVEHHKKLMKNPRWQWNLIRRYSVLDLKNGGTYLMKHDVLFNALATISSFLLPVVLLLNHICWKKYGKGLTTRRDDFFVCIMYFFAILMGFMIDVGKGLTETLKVWMMLSLAFLPGIKPALLLFSIFLSSSISVLR
ncbi:dolichyl-phosphate-mannose protein O-mannosyltransferase-like protein [Encephalitozoon romaleae SJ-2008]|uniref:Dolichyl-phosphate-mannose protein O-mannosyltransferase-like protein n=1 Tax=Encephalitozoon romaleae (strain SJ-2008) TaxID=1178016 RepID=I7AS27_ENCRO|nr:dolichyl-phosphate-mannose protein O-mannosyltransferase-like protein [Encephalitozoon romaleae SJ-2008]AFN83182.1 dolichyl-phosphate-mannose protein O-mannosyltransferase-like protein [Encephalitozoon romaleae SJ-2008]